MLAEGTVCSVKVRPLHLHPQNHHSLVLPRPRRLGDARSNYRGYRSYIPRNLILRYTAPGDLMLDQHDYPSGAGIHVCLRGIRVCALTRRDSGWLAPGLLLWSASYWDVAPWVWISIPMMSWSPATGLILHTCRWMLSIKYIVIRAHPCHPCNPCPIVFQEFLRVCCLFLFMDGAALWAGCCMGF